MNKITELDDRKILSMRGRKNHVDPDRPYAWLVEKERTASGLIEDVAVIFLTNRECPFHCLMCDLWKNTTDFTVRKGQIAAQIKLALASLPVVKHVKLYNSGSFFDPRAIPPGDYAEISETLSGFDTITVESHPAFINSHCLDFRNMLKGKLEVALGLETVHPGISAYLNKKMSAESFMKAASFLNENDILTRAFILLKTPFMDEEEGLFWAERSIDFAFSQGIRCCSIIPVRPGNGAMEYLQQLGYYSPPLISSLEKVMEYGIILGCGRVFADTWDLKLFSKCTFCLDKRIARLNEMNLTQKIPPLVSCNCEKAKECPTRYLSQEWHPR